VAAKSNEYGVTIVRHQLGRFIDLADEGEPTFITIHGRRAAAIVPASWAQERLSGRTCACSATSTLSKTPTTPDGDSAPSGVSAATSLE
jgi:antitoxin (DNA-binding transcriptional repressor) of toxin-antitoxin stability system